MRIVIWSPLMVISAVGFDLDIIFRATQFTPETNMD